MVGPCSSAATESDFGIESRMLSESELGSACIVMNAYRSAELVCFLICPEAIPDVVNDWRVIDIGAVVAKDLDANVAMCFSSDAKLLVWPMTAELCGVPIRCGDTQSISESLNAHSTNCRHSMPFPTRLSVAATEQLGRRSR